MKCFLFALSLLLGATSISAQTSSELSKIEQYKAEVRSKLQLDYSMPDYSTSKIDSKVMGSRLANFPIFADTLRINKR